MGEQIILLGNHAARGCLEAGAPCHGRRAGARQRGERRELSSGFGPHSVLECVGLEQAVVTGFEIARPGGAIGRVGVPEHDTSPTNIAFWKNASMAGGPAPVQAYIDELLADVLAGHIQPGACSIGRERSTRCRTAIAR